MRPSVRWAPFAILCLGALLTSGIQRQKALPLRAPLDSSIPLQIAGLHGRDLALSDWERDAVGVSDYLLRVYSPATDAEAARGAAASVYVGYYGSQTQGKTIHSPKNCLPGAGWEPLQSRTEVIPTAHGPVTVNRYLIQRGSERALVLYWYQGRGRIEANEYLVKRDLLRDAALRGRSEEALVRVLVPVSGAEAEAFDMAARMAQEVIPRVYLALPT